MEFSIQNLDSAVNFSGSDTSCADICLSYCTIIINPYGLDICIPLPLCMSVGVGYTISTYLSFATYLAFSWHLPHLLFSSNYLKLLSSFSLRTVKIITQSILIIQGVLSFFMVNLYFFLFNHVFLYFFMILPCNFPSHILLRANACMNKSAIILRAGTSHILHDWLNA